MYKNFYMDDCLKSLPTESLKEKHNIEQQLEMLQKQKEQMDIDTKIAASNAKLSVLKDFEQGADSIVTDGIESYVNKQSKSTTCLQSMKQSRWSTI